MAQGISVPLKTKNGRLQLLSGDDYIDMLVRIALGDNQSDNPFQDIGLGAEQWIFGINDGMAEGEIKRAVVAVFESLERDQLAKIQERDISFDRSEEGVLKMDLTYTNIETQERVELEVPIPPEGV